MFFLTIIPMLSVAADKSPPADQDGLCVAKVQHLPQGDVMVWQHLFDDGVFDLAIAQVIDGQPVHLTRLSFKGSKVAMCHFPVFVVMKGGDWGWHIAWSSLHKQAIYYARVDREMWVSSLPKKIRNEPTDFLELTGKDGLLMLKYVDKPGLNPALSIATSADEGRSWDLPPQQ